MKKNKLIIAFLLFLFVLMMSLPWLVPHTGWLSLLGLVPLLCAERIARGVGLKHFFWWYYAAFSAWNFATTFWVCEATVGGGIFASLANAFQMALVFALFRFSTKHFKGALPYVFLMLAWIVWERLYFDAEISWPWLTLGYAFASTTRLVQWYSVTGALGGSLWIWLCNLSVFAVMAAVSSGDWYWKGLRQQILTCVLVFLLFAAPVSLSLISFHNYEEKSEARVTAMIGQPNFDPYQKFKSMTQARQTEILLDGFNDALCSSSVPDLFLVPETFTSDVDLGSVRSGATFQEFQDFLADKPGSSIIFGASTYDCHTTASCPDIRAYKYPWGWLVNHNSAIATDNTGRAEIYHKSKLVVGTELTPYPAIFTKIDAFLCRLFGVRGPMMGRCVGQERPSLLHLSDGTPVACAVCYESVYGEYCAEFVKLGAKLLTVITNDAWWGNTPGYRQHLSYSSIRAIELRRDIVRCGNTGISAFIDQRGEIVRSTDWWTRTVLSGEANLNGELTPFVRYGDIAGKTCMLAFVLMLLSLLVKLFIRKE